MAGPNPTLNFTVITDTHGYPWGPTTADFDLGDNTNSYPAASEIYREPVHETTGQKIKLVGNHDFFETNTNSGKLQTWPDNTNKVIVYGLDVNITSWARYEIPPDQIYSLIADLNTRGAGWDVVVLTHTPLFKLPADYAPEWYGGCPNNAADLVNVLVAYNEKKQVPIRKRAQPRKSTTTTQQQIQGM